MAKTKFRIAAFNAHVEEKAERFVTIAAIAGENETKDILGPNPPRTGRKYKRGSKTHIASAPGQSPAIDTGRLRQSVASHPATKQGNKVTAATGVATEYAILLETGTEKMARRPHISRLNERARRERIFNTAARSIRD